MTLTTTVGALRTIHPARRRSLAAAATRRSNNDVAYLQTHMLRLIANAVGAAQCNAHNCHQRSLGVRLNQRLDALQRAGFTEQMLLKLLGQANIDLTTEQEFTYNQITGTSMAALSDFQRATMVAINSGQYRLEFHLIGYFGSYVEVFVPIRIAPQV